MGYRKADDILPPSLLLAVQEYIDGAYVYIPRREGRRRPWGTPTRGRQKLRIRNAEIARRRAAGASAHELAAAYFLSVKTIYKILASCRPDR